MKEMICITGDKEEVKKFMNAINELAQKITMGEIDHSDQDGELLAPYPDGEFAGQLGMWLSGAIACRTTPIGYQTVSGYGKYFISYDLRTGRPLLVFQGRRNSFKSGCGYLEFYPSPEVNWEVIGSEQPDRSAFD
jgi:hypothetical protein